MSEDSKGMEDKLSPNELIKLVEMVPRWKFRNNTPQNMRNGVNRDYSLEGIVDGVEVNINHEYVKSYLDGEKMWAYNISASINDTFLGEAYYQSYQVIGPHSTSGNHAVKKAVNQALKMYENDQEKYAKSDFATARKIINSR